MIPGARWAELALIAFVISLATGAFMEQHHQNVALKAQVAAKQQRIDQIIAAYSEAAASAAVARQAETAHRMATQGEIANESQRFVNRALDDAAVRRAAADRLRVATASVAAGYAARSADPAAAAPSAPASSPGDLLADVQRRIGEAAGSIGEYADAAHAAGQQCAADYDALTPISISLPKMVLDK